MYSTATAPYSNQLWCCFNQLLKIRHVNNAPYVLCKGLNCDIHVYEINQSKYDSLDTRNYPWAYNTTINNELINWNEINVILYSHKEGLLWFISDACDPDGLNKYYYFKLVAYSIQNKQSL